MKLNTQMTLKVSLSDPPGFFLIPGNKYFFYWIIAKIRNKEKPVTSNGLSKNRYFCHWMNDSLQPTSWEQMGFK